MQPRKENLTSEDIDFYLQRGRLERAKVAIRMLKALKNAACRMLCYIKRGVTRSCQNQNREQV